MSPKRLKTAHKPRGVQEWILAELRKLKPGERLPTSQTLKRVSRANGKAYQKNSVYEALRHLVQRGDILSKRAGHEKQYRIATPVPHSDGTRPVPSKPPTKWVRAIREPRGAQKWIPAELREQSPGARLSTSENATRIGQATGRTYSPTLMSYAMRHLVQRGELDVGRVGNAKVYRSVTPVPPRSSAPALPGRVRRCSPPLSRPSKPHPSTTSLR